tara:strand:+ start:4580 stop:5299 length:720 start_codon:yes stop_codon:yes gene_type:complete
MSKVKEKTAEEFLPVEEMSEEEKAELMEKDRKKVNMELWDKLFHTDPNFTKPMYGGMTTIDAYYQVREMTKEFGPAGQGWGWTVEETNNHDPRLVVLRVALWYTLDNERFDVPPQFGSSTIDLPYPDKEGNPQIDKDSWKKAVTDGISKSCSYIGMGGDVFLGRFDDNKYVEEMKERFKEPVDTVNLSESKDAIRKAFSKDEAWAVSILDWAEVGSVDKMSNEQIIEVMKMIKPEGGEA